MNIQSFEKWSVKKPLVIAGPCSAETEEQLLSTCLNIAQNGGVDVLRAGIWKPRTRPGSFEGVGEKGLLWLKKAKEQTGLPTTIEVAKPQHVELALKYGVDMLWLGARSTVNPFTVQEIADALQGVDVPVIIKNPINPDVALWMGAIERIYRAGVTKVAALHRGFSSFEKTKYRNQPMWKLAIELKSYIPTIPLFCDPSHIGGKRELIEPISQKALDLNYDGLMIETHIKPDEAWSDAKQQVTPTSLHQLLDNLQIRKASIDNAELTNHLEILRSKIDRIDREIIEALAARMELVDEIGDYKKENNLAVFQPERWKNVFETRPEWAVEQGLTEDFIKQVYHTIHYESIRLQSQQFKDTGVKV